MTYRSILLAAGLALASTPLARADALQPIEGRAFHIGDVSGLVYYTAEADGLHVVATLNQPGANPVPVRMEAILEPGQSVVLSTPREVGTLPETIVISREADRVQVRKGVRTATN